MKYKLFFLLFSTLTIAASAHTAPKVLLAQTDTSKVAQVKAGTLKTAKASWWGFNKEDSTDALQNAINSKVPTLIVDNMNSPWIVAKTIQLASNQKIIFEKGVIIEAMKGKFKGVGDCLLRGSNIHNLIMEGNGDVILRMQKADYDNPKLYTHAEWRSGISLYDSKDITLRNFTVSKTGGDGVYLGATAEGYNENIVIEKVLFDDNYRQGISIISAQNLTIRNCIFTNTSGTAPAAGIDFEPNQKGQRLINCVVENSLFSNNEGGAISISPAQLDSTSKPLSIQIKDCQFNGPNNAVGMWPVKTPRQKSVTGNVDFINCTFNRSTIFLIDVVKDGISYLFKNCIMTSGSQYESIKTPLIIRTDERVNNPILGTMTFDNVTMNLEENQHPFRLEFWGEATVSDQITGDIKVNRNRQTHNINLPAYIQNNRAELEIPSSVRFQKMKEALPWPSDEQRAEIQNRINELEKTGQLQKNLVENGDFSETKGTGKEIAPYWTQWQAIESMGNITIDTTLNHSGETGGSIQLSKINRGSALNYIKVTPGETYVIRAWMRREGQGVAGLSGGWMTADKKWLPGAPGSGFYPTKDDAENTWHLLQGVLTAPKDAVYMQLSLGASYQNKAQDKIWFDDVTVYNIKD